MPILAFKQVDVFATAPLKGNPLAVVIGADELSDEKMAAFANWTNLSETTFLLKPTSPDADYRVRIFTPGGELPFAGHPTLGSCHVWLATGGQPRGEEVVQECPAGLIRLRRDDSRLAFAATPLEAQEQAYALGTHVVVKVLCRDLLHKSEAGAVRVDVLVADVARVSEEMRASVAAAAAVRQEGFLVQELVVGGTEMIVGFRRDPQLGGAVLVGLGGIATELFNDTAMRLLPLGRSDVEAMLGELKCHPALPGARGRPPVDMEALVDAILSFAAMATSLGAHLREAEINPLFVLPQGRGVRAADGVVLLS